MSETKWTPGPWNTGGIFNPGSADERQNVWGPRARPEDQSGTIIAECLTIGNARLVQAAPELYKALARAEEILLGSPLYYAQGGNGEFIGVVIKRVLAKARGEV